MGVFSHLSLDLTGSFWSRNSPWGVSQSSAFSVDASSLSTPQLCQKNLEFDVEHLQSTLQY